jgi:phosphatidylglycerol:prolipoprotein diacylglycerol transferase
MKQVLFEIPGLGLPIYGFGLMMVLGFLSGIWLARRRAEQLGIDPEIISNLGMICLIGGIVGCRLLYVVHFWSEDFAPRFAREGFLPGLLHVIDVRSGGLEFLGGLVLTTLLVVGYVTWKRLPLGTLMDILVPSLALGHALGKVGCFLNGCCYGAVCEPAFPTAAVFPKNEAVVRTIDREGREITETRPTGSQPFVDHVAQKHWLAYAPGVPQGSLPVHPTQLYEMTGDLILVVLLTVYFGHRRRPGEVVALYFLLYAPERFVLEFVRTEPRDVQVFGLVTTVHQAAAAVLTIAALGVWLWLRRGPAAGGAGGPPQAVGAA